MTTRTIILQDGDLGVIIEALMTKRFAIEAAPEANVNAALKLAGTVFQAMGAAPSHSCKADYVLFLKDLEKRLTAQSRIPR